MDHPGICGKHKINDAGTRTKDAFDWQIQWLYYYYGTLQITILNKICDCSAQLWFIKSSNVSYLNICNLDDKTRNSYTTYRHLAVLPLAKRDSRRSSHLRVAYNMESTLDRKWKFCICNRIHLWLVSLFLKPRQGTRKATHFLYFGFNRIYRQKRLGASGSPLFWLQPV